MAEVSTLLKLTQGALHYISIFQNTLYVSGQGPWFLKVTAAAVATSSDCDYSLVQK